MRFFIVKRSVAVFSFFILCVFLLFSEQAFAAANYGAMADIFKDSVTKIGELLKIIFPVGGFALIGFGLFKFISNNPQETFFDRAVWIIAGAFLVAIGGFLAASAGSWGLTPGTGGITF